LAVNNRGISAGHLKAIVMVPKPSPGPMLERMGPDLETFPARRVIPMLTAKFFKGAPGGPCWIMGLAMDYSRFRAGAVIAGERALAVKRMGTGGRFCCVFPAPPISAPA